MLTKKVFALLALGGHIQASRAIPRPWEYKLTDGAGRFVTTLTDDDVVALLKRGAIAPPKKIGFDIDAYGYTVADIEALQRKALESYTYGFGQCAECGDVVAIDIDGDCARHGFTTVRLEAERRHTAPCDGTGKAASRFVLEPSKASA